MTFPPANFDPSIDPTADQVRDKFTFSYVFSPVPAAGDMRVDLPAEALDVVRAQFAKVHEHIYGHNVLLLDLALSCCLN